MGSTRSSHASPAIVLDAGALIALDRRNPRMIALLRQALIQRRAILVPAGVVAKAWRNGRVQANLARFLRSLDVEIVPLDGHLARASGELCGANGSADVIDASVVILARHRGDLIVTSDPGDILRLDPAASIIAL